MLVSTVSWTVEKHFCFGSLVDIAFFHEADTCGMERPLSKDNVALNKDSNSCCSDEIYFGSGTGRIKYFL